MILDHVFAKCTAVASDLGYAIAVEGGSHWLADDPLVLARPDLFTQDCRYGLSFSGEPPECLSVPPEDEPAAPAASRQQGRRMAAAR